MLSLNTKFTIKARAPLQRRICRQENSRSASPRSGKLAGAMAVEVEGGGKRFRSRTNRPASSSVLRNILLFSTWDIYVHTQNRGNIHTDPSSLSCHSRLFFVTPPSSTQQGIRCSDSLLLHAYLYLHRKMP